MYCSKQTSLIVLFIGLFIYLAHGFFPAHPQAQQHCQQPLRSPFRRPANFRPPVEVESRTFEQIYQAALAEGGKLVIYSGGDFNGQFENKKQAFLSAFPGLDVQIIVDQSKYHDARIEYQLRTKNIVFDVAILHSLHSFPRWRDEGYLLNYKPIGFDKIFDEFRDPEGYFYGLHVNYYGNNIYTPWFKNETDWPTEARDYLRPEFYKKLVLNYPNDDDTILFMFKQLADKYGFQHLYKLKAQEPMLVRGIYNAWAAVAAGIFPATFTTGNPGGSSSCSTSFVLPKDDPFLMWAQMGAIFAQSPHPEAAKLYMSWSLNKTVQEDLDGTFSVRRDVSPPEGFRGIFQYKNSDPTAFARWMVNRRAVETFRDQVALIFGEVKGESSTDSIYYGPYPTVEPATRSWK